MSFTPLCALPWRQPATTRTPLSEHWVEPTLLVRRVDVWRSWLDTQPGGRWICV